MSMIDAYLDALWLEQGASDHTLAAYRRDLTAWQQWLAEEGQRFNHQLRHIPGLTVYPGRANYLFLRCDVADLDLQYGMLQQHILIRSCANYPGLDGRYFRVAIRSQQENTRLLTAFRRVFNE